MSQQQDLNERVIKLDFPISVGDGKSITELRFGRMKLKHLRAVPERLFKGDKDTKLNGPELITLVSSLSGVEEKCIDELDISDMAKLEDVLTDFLSESLKEIGSD